MPPLTIRLNPADNVVVARVDLLPGTELASERITVGGHVPAGHKVATAPVAPTGIPALPPIRRSAPPPTCWCATAAP